MKKYNLEEIKYIVESYGFELISQEYNGANYPIIIKDKEGYYGRSLINSIIKCSNFKRFHKSNPYTIQNIKLWIKLNNKPFELISDKYLGQYKDLEWLCKKDGCLEYFKSSWVEIYAGNGCSFCHGKSVGLSNCLANKNPELSKQLHPYLNGNITAYDITLKSGQYLWWKCLECDHEWFARVADRSNNKGCPKCNESKGEKQLDIILSKYNIPHDSQHTFDDLIGINGGLLRFDSSVFWDKGKNNLRCLIEYDGEFHYKKFYDGDGFETIQIHDELKNQYCKKNNIILIRIPYWDLNNIEEILIKELNIHITNNGNLTVVF